MYKILKLTFLSLTLATLAIGCSNKNQDNDLGANEYNPRFNEFMACEKGSEYSPENLSQMISDWRAFQLSEEMMGAFFHDPINEKNTFGPTAWWEFQKLWCCTYQLRHKYHSLQINSHQRHSSLGIHH